MSRLGENDRRIAEVHKDSIADELGIKPGDILLSIDGQEIKDIFDYRLRMMTEDLTVTFRLADGSLLEAEIEKDEEDDLGLVFEEPLLDQCSSCKNACVFCFIDQLPKGLRPTLYFKDDDLRMSFLTGNYVTLTNLSDEEFDRLLSYRLSPMNVSVHATDPKVRVHLMKNPSAGQIIDRLRAIVATGITLNCQIVLCPGINDGAVLDQTLKDLSDLGDLLLSVAVVPVGITKFRAENNLSPIDLFNKKTASTVLTQVKRWQKYFLDTRGRRLFYAADEFFLRAHKPIPAVSWYEGFPQLENGVGLISEHRHQLKAGLRRRERMSTNYLETASPLEKQLAVTAKPHAMVWLICGVDAAPHLESFAVRISMLYNISLQVKVVVNDFFGDTITVSGLLTGDDILRSINHEILKINTTMSPTGILMDGKPQGYPDLILLPDCCLKADEDIFLDDMTVEELQHKLGLPIIISSVKGQGLLDSLDQYTGLFASRKSRPMGSTDSRKYVTAQQSPVKEDNNHE